MNKALLIFLLSIFSFISLILPFLEAAECGSTPTNSCTVSRSTTFTPGTYQLSYGPDIIAPDVVLDCNGATLIGTRASSSNGIAIENVRATVKNCNIINYVNGIRLTSATRDNTIINNYVSSNRDHGISFDRSNYNNVSHNIVINNNMDGIEPFSSSNNLIYDNNFTNDNNVRNGGGSNNNWNISKTLETNILGGSFQGGNYFSDYAGVDLNNDGIGDTNIPYAGGSALDYLPLVAVQPPQLILSPRITSPPRLGNTIDISLTDPANPGASYLLLMSFGDAPGIMLSDGRIIPLNDDFLFQTSLFNPLTLSLFDSQSRFDINGQGSAYWVIPNFPALEGMDIYFGFLTVNLRNPLPQAVMAISHSQKIKILPNHFTPDANTVALWDFNENSGSIVHDLTNNHNDGQLQREATWVQGIEGSALQFDGIDDYVNVSNNPSLILTNAFTIEAYVNYEGGLHDTTVDTILGKDYQYVLGVGDNIYPNHLAFTLADQPSNLCGGSVWCDGVAEVPQNTWHHVAVQYDGQIVKTIIDGQIVSEYPSQFTVGNANTQLGIGARLTFALDSDPEPVAFFKGKIDELRISNIARY